MVKILMFMEIAIDYCYIVEVLIVKDNLLRKICYNLSVIYRPNIINIRKAFHIQVDLND